MNAVQALMVNKILRQTSAEKKLQVENFNDSTLQEFINVIIDPTTGKMMEYHHFISNEQTKETYPT